MPVRDLTLVSRRENTRSIPASPVIKIFEIDEIELHFQESINAVEYKFVVSDALKDIDKPTEAKDVLRTQIVFLESAFDFYLHEIVKLGIICMFNGYWTKTDKYYELILKMHYIERALSESDNLSWLKDWINANYSSQTLMSFDSFKSVCKLLGLDIKAIANASFYEEGSKDPTSNKLKNFLTELYIRRNRIAHQSDRRMADAERQNVSKDYVYVSIQRIKDIVKAMSEEIRKKYS